jgi:hypothetical protein
MKAAPKLILALFVFTAPLYLLAHSLVSTILRPQTYHRLLEDLRVTERIGPAFVQKGLTETLPLTDERSPADPSQRALPDLPPAAWETIADELLPSDWLSDQAHIVVDGLFIWLAGNDPLPSVQIDLRPVLDRLQSASGTLVLLFFLGNAPACDLGEAPTGSGVYTSCLPMDANIEGWAHESAVRLTEVLPREMGYASLLSLGLVERDTVPRLNRIRFAAQWASTTVRLWGNLCGLLLAIYGLLTIRDWRSLLTKTILPLGWVGGLSLLLALILAAISQSGALTSFLPPGLSSLEQEVVGYLGRAAALRLALWSAGLLVIAAALWGIHYFIQARQRRPIPPERKQTRVRRQFG